MVTLSVTPSRVAIVLRVAAISLETYGWDPHRYSVIYAIDRAAGFVKPGINPAAEETTIRAWDALAAHLGTRPDVWEQGPGRTTAEVLAALRAAAGKGGAA